ncbi:DUF4279 domain-containing protein [Actinospica durhamensis]|uniref:DUF4279 domain-containing protein n=1 Tax=Actinospica durhamensis TaxID=1508375 RepID=A0A941ISD7_9ACTN|nr:DUF4279 domain-containing protein [Actinospica durhamensis]MBR7836262.1 DUF4279 domain-containing protein [Actinospica durhamensis]
MPLHQYAYFALASRHTSAAEMAAFLGIEPDETMVRASRLLTQPRAIPASHAWKVVCRDPGLRVDEQVARVIARLAPHTERIAALVERLKAEEDGEYGSAVLEIVRYFNDDEEGPTSDDGVPAWRTSTTEKPNMFGWHLDRHVLNFLTATGAVLDVDEYDMSPGNDPRDWA